MCDAGVAAGSDGAERDDTIGALFQTSDLDDAPRDLSAEHARPEGAQTNPTDAEAADDPDPSATPGWPTVDR